MQREIGNLVARVTLDGTRFQHGVSNLNRQLKLVQSEFQAASSKLGDFGKKSDQLRLKADLLARQIEIGKKKVEALKKTLQESTETKGKDAKATQELQIKLNRATAAVSSFEHKLKGVNKEIQKISFHPFTEKMDKVSQKMKHVGGQLLELGGTLTLLASPLAVLGITALRTSIKFESAFAGVRKTVEATEAEYKQLEQAIMEMSKHVPTSMEEIAHVAEVSGQLGVGKKDILSFTRTIIDLGVATNMSSEEAATALARFANVMQMPLSKIGRLGSAVSSLGNILATTESEIVEMALRIAGAGHQAGLTEAQVMSLAGALSSVGINAEAGGSSISRVIIEIDSAVRSGGQKLSLFAQLAGMSSQKFVKAFKHDAASAMIDFIEGLGKMNKKGEDTFGVLKKLGLSEILVRDTLLRASGAGDLFRKSLEKGTKAWKENTALTKEANERYKTFESKLKMAQNRLQKVSKSLGDALKKPVGEIMEMLEPVFGFLEGLVKSFSSLNPTLQTIIVLFAGVVAILGPVIIAVGILCSAIGSLAAVFGVTFGAILIPIGIAVAAIFAVIAIGVLLYKNWDTIKKKAIEIWGSITKQIDQWGNEFSAAVKKARENGKKLIQNYSHMNNKIIAWLKSIPIKVASALKNMKDKIVTTFTSIKAKVIEKVQGLINHLKSIDLVSVGRNILQGLIKGIGDMAHRVWKKAQEIAQGIQSRIQSVLKIASPSKVMVEMGRFTGEGLIVGMKATLPRIMNQASQMARAAIAVPAPVPSKFLISPNSNVTEAASSVHIHFNQPVIIREEADIKKIARSIAREQRITERAKGRMQIASSFS
jgi:TP901 family phage tail tape measure protein